MKSLFCADAGFDCKAVIKGHTEEEVLRLAEEHARTVHGVELTPQIASHIKTLIREEEEEKTEA